MKKALLVLWLIVVFSGIAFLFWHNEWKYNLPTPIPLNYQAVNPGTVIHIKAVRPVKDNKPLFLHFFNPDCPCSRFNITHFKSLVKQYAGKISFAIVVLSKSKEYNATYIQHKYSLDIPVFFDSSIAFQCGVYSTPQAVVIDTDEKLYYRGNYNKSRYCTDAKSNYAQMAIDSLLNKTSKPVFSALALTSYGCQLPVCNR